MDRERAQRLALLSARSRRSRVVDRNQAICEAYRHDRNKSRLARQFGLSRMTILRVLHQAPVQR